MADDLTAASAATVDTDWQKYNEWLDKFHLENSAKHHALLCASRVAGPEFTAHSVVVMARTFEAYLLEVKRPKRPESSADQQASVEVA